SGWSLDSYCYCSRCCRQGYYSATSGRPDRCWAGDLLLSGGGCKPDRRYVCLPRTFDWLPDPGSQVCPHQYGDSDSPVINSTSARQMRFAWQLSKKRLPCNQGSLCHLRQENLGTKKKLLDDG